MGLKTEGLLSKGACNWNLKKWRCSGLKVSVLVLGLSGPGLSPGQGHHVVFLGKALSSHSATRYWLIVGET